MREGAACLSRLRRPNVHRSLRPIRDAIPGVLHRLLDVLPGISAPQLITIPAGAQVPFDVVPLAAAVGGSRFDSVAIGGAIVLEAEVRARVRSGLPVVPPV